MKLSLNDLKAQVAHTKAASTQKAVETTAAAKEAANTFAAKTVVAAKTTGSAIRRVAPVTNGKFEDIVSQLNSRHNDTDRDLWKNKIGIHMIAQATGVNLSSDEELDVLYDQFQAEERAQKEAEEKARLQAEAVKAQNTAPVEEQDLFERLAASMAQLVRKELAPLTQMVPGTDVNEGLAAAIAPAPEVVKEEVPAVEEAKEEAPVAPVVPAVEQVEEEATVEAKPKKNGGRRKLPRQQPIN